MKHTPGPWFAGTTTSGRGISMGVKTVSGKYIASTGDHFVACGSVHPQFTSSENYEDNAKLIAAAPELLDALKALTGYIDREGPAAKEWQAISDWVEKGQAAIAKAEGRQ